MFSKCGYAGFGIGLRSPYFEQLSACHPDIDWLEIITEDYLIEGGAPLYYLERIRQHFPLVMHGVSMSLGSADPLNLDYLSRLKALMQRIQPLWVSDHCCWMGVNQVNLHDLMPMPYTQEAVSHMVSRIQYVQDYLQRPLVLENVSSYITYKDSQMSEWEFLSQICQRSGCLLLLDVNNVYVSAYNHGFDPLQYLEGIPVDRVQQIHLAGHKHCGSHIVDTHDDVIIDRVWDLYANAIDRFGQVSTLIERDANIPPLCDLVSELNRARHVFSKHYVAETAL